MKPYSYDLRIRIYNYSLTHSIRKTAAVFSVSPNTVLLLKKLFIETGSLNPRDRSFQPPHLITPKGEIYLQLLLDNEVDLTLEEIREHYEKKFGILVSIGTMYNTLKNLNITRKKKTFSDPKKSTDEVKVKKEIYDEKLNEIDPEKYLNVKEVARRLSVSERTIFSRIKGGSINAKKIGKEWRIEANSLPVQEKETPIDYLKNTILILERELEAKNKQIDQLNERIRELHVLLGAKALPEGRGSKPWWKFWG